MTALPVELSFSCQVLKSVSKANSSVVVVAEVDVAHLAGHWPMFIQSKSKM